MTTRAKLSEQIQLAYSRYLDKNNFKTIIDAREVDLLLEQVINKYFKINIEYNLGLGTTEIPQAAMVNYTLSITNGAITLPIIPMALPNDTGVYSIASTVTPLDFVIPLPNQFINVYKGTKNQLVEGQVAYYRIGNTVRFIGNITGQVAVTIIASDFSLFTTTDMLPILPETETDVVREVLDILMATRASQQELNSQNIDGRDNA